MPDSAERSSAELPNLPLEDALATTLERWDDAERHFQTALAMNERIGARPWLAHTQDDCAAMLLGRGRPCRSEAGE